LEVDLMCPSETRGIGHWSNQTSRIEGKELARSPMVIARSCIIVV